jgi:hypothetical protein
MLTYIYRTNLLYAYVHFTQKNVTLTQQHFVK